MPRANNGPRLKRNPFGLWEIRWSERGRQRRRSTGTENYGFAQKVLASFVLLDDRQKAVEVEDAPLLVCEVLGHPDAQAGADYWHEHVLPKVVCKDSARYSIVKLLKHFGPIAVRDIMPRDVDLYVTDRRSGRLGKPSVNHTISRELSVLNAAINHAVKARRVPRGEVPFIKLPGVSEPRDVWLTEDQADALLRAAAIPQGGQRWTRPECLPRHLRRPLNKLSKRERVLEVGRREAEQRRRKAEKERLPRVYLFIALALATASRKSALLELTWGQIDFSGGMIYLNPPGRRQTTKRRPRVPISNELRPILERAWREAENPDAATPVFGEFASIRGSFARAVCHAGLPRNITPHVLRHTWATWAAQSGMDMWKIAGVLGDSVETVIRTYAHHHPDHLRDAVNNVRPSRRPDLRIVA